MSEHDLAFHFGDLALKREADLFQDTCNNRSVGGLELLPASAVLWTGKRSIVYVKQDGGEPIFRLREIEPGPKLGECYVVLSELSDGKEIVSHGAFSVDAAAQLEGKPSMMNPSGVHVSTGHNHEEMTGENKVMKMNQDAITPQLEHQMIKVAGNCEMCKERIETAAKSVTGVASAEWETETNMLDVTFDDTKTSVDMIEIAVARVGNDTPHHKASAEVYDNLPGCCKYD